MAYITRAAVEALAAGLAVTTPGRNDPSTNRPPHAIYSATRAGGGSAASLSALLAEWDHAAFTPPGKPGQSRVYGRAGYMTTGGGYNFLVTLIRSAGNDVQAGRDHEAALKIAK